MRFHTRSRQLCALGSAVVLAATVAGCQAAAASSGQDFLDYPAKNAEYQAAQRLLTLPVGVRWPGGAPGDQKNSSYERGAGASDAEWYWFCSWSREWLAQHGKDPARTQQAMHQLLTVKDKRLYSVASAPETRTATDGYLRKAELGDPSGLDRDVALNCPTPA